MEQPKSVFDVKIGQRVYNVFQNRYGRISDVRETSYEWIEAFVKWDDAEKEEILHVGTPHIKFVSE